MDVVIIPSTRYNSSLPLFSIVTPSFNQGQFIRETIESVLGQSYSHIEYWVIDGGSTDNTVSILKEYESDPRFHWISEKDNGQSDAINKGLARCTGDIFSWLNSDDVLLPHALQVVADVWLSINQPILVYGFARLIDESGIDLGYCPGQSAHITLAKLLRLQNLIVQPSTFAPTKDVRALGGVDPSLQYTMDLDLWVRLAERLPIQHTPHELALYRLHTSSKTIAAPVKFVHDVEIVLLKAAARGLISMQQVQVRTRLFAARIYLTPEIGQHAQALSELIAALRGDWLILPEATLIVLKAFIRLVLNHRLWSTMRLVQVKLR